MARLRAFSLVELLVTMAVVSALFLILFAILEKSSSAWNDAEKTIDSFREARIALNFISRDLSSLVMPESVDSFFVNGDQSTSSITISGNKPPVGHGDTLFFLSAQPRQTQNSSDTSDVCKIGYFSGFSIDIDPTQSFVSPTSSYKLYRHFRRSNDTFSDYLGYLSGGLFAQAATLQGADQEILAQGIIEFKIACYEKDPVGKLQIVSPWDPAKKPAMVSVQFDCIDKTSARLLETQQAWIDSTNPIVIANRRSFSTRISIRQ